MVDKFKNLITKIEADKGGQITLLALLKMDEFLDKWVIVFCAPWAPTTKREEIFKYLSNEILAVLTKEEVLEISHLAIYDKGEHLIEELLKYQSGVELKDQKINGNKVHFAQIIKSNR